MVLASCTGYAKLMPKINCQAKLLYALLTSRELGEAQEARMLHCLRESLSFLGTERHSVPPEPRVLT